jgi:ATP-binding cassette subfamily B (MDR/TAP) protein 1
MYPIDVNKHIVEWHSNTVRVPIDFFRDINKIADGIGAKYGRIISSVVSFIVGYTIGFIYVWQLTLVMLSLFPLMVIVGAMMSKVGR